MTRYFVGIELPAELRQRLALLRGKVQGARWIESDDIHLTLRFVGDVNAPDLETFLNNLDQIAHAPFSLQPGELGTFGHAKPRSIWLGLAPSTELQELQHQVDSAARQADLPPAGRKFTPHITLARMSRGNPRNVARYLDETGMPVILPFPVTRFTLFSSGRSRGGGPYAIEETFPLTPRDQSDEPLTRA